MTCTSLLLAVLCAPSLGGELGAATKPPVDDWAGLDRELAAWTRPRPGADTSGPRPTIRLQILGARSTGEGFAVSGGDELGVTLRQLQLGLRGEIGRFAYLFRVQARDAPRIQAARVAWRPVDGWTLRLGNLPVILSRNVPRPNVMFVERSRQARTLRRRDGGFELEWESPFARAVIGAHNGGDGTGDDLLLLGRVEANLIGSGEVRQEFSPSVDAATVLVVGAAILDEGTLADGTIWIADAALVHRRLFLHGEVVGYADDFVPSAVPVGPAALASGSGGRIPFGATCGVRFDERWDAGLRFEWADDSDRTWDVLVGLNRTLPDIGARLQLNWRVRESDAGALAGQRWVLGLFWSI